ncbi:MAG: carbohydrate kinase, partial [Desulfofustis sp.]
MIQDNAGARQPTQCRRIGGWFVGAQGQENERGIGEVLWDIVGEHETLGGAPVNFAYHAGQLGAESWPVSAVGADERGRRAIGSLQSHDVATDHIIEVEGAPPGYVRATVDGDGVASYTFPDDVAWDHLQIVQKTLDLAARLDAVCFGSLAQRSARSREAIHRFLDALPPAALKIFDLNIRQDFYSQKIIRDSLIKADVLKLNDEELTLMAGLEDLGGSPEEQARQLMGRFDLSLVVLTRGGNGSLLISPDELSEHPGFKTDVVDTIGAGDSFTAVTAMGLLRGYSLQQINEQ